MMREDTHHGISLSLFLGTQTQAKGGIDITADSLGRILVNDTKAMDDFGKKMGYKNNDELVSLNGETLTIGNGSALIQNSIPLQKKAIP